ncbi:hypothetical protein H0H87_001982 [Tephrocybe sp. NHM501043]|nr:hypothetical protein H0H87_001982 [Tephrocybe sp. NHM501043]
MDSWPVDDRNPTSGNSESKGGPKAEQQASVRGYPQVDVGGPNVITLVEKDGRLEWTSIVKNIGKANYIRPGKNTIIFPTTRPPPSERPSRTILQSAERGANFLRTYLPDVDIPAELIRDELAQDAKISEKLGLFDPYMGNLLQPVTVYDSAFLAFPMGELNRDLSNFEPFSSLKSG